LAAYSLDSASVYASLALRAVIAAFLANLVSFNFCSSARSASYSAFYWFSFAVFASLSAAILAASAFIARSLASKAADSDILASRTAYEASFYASNFASSAS